MTRALRFWWMAAVVTLVPASFNVPAAAADYADTIIRGGLVYDGSGKPGRVADVAIKGDRIIAIGNLRGRSAHNTIDATGLAVSPGFIHMLSWATTSLILDPKSQSDNR